MRGFGEIAVKVWLCAVCVQAFVLLGFFNALVNVRQDEVKREVASTVSRAVDVASAKVALGLSLRLHLDLQKQLGTLAEVNSGLDLFLLNPDGTILFSSDQSMTGSEIPATWIDTAQPGGQVVVREINGETIGVAQIINGQSATVAYVVVRADSGHLLIEAVSALVSPAKVTALFLIVVLVLAGVGVRLAVQELGANVGTIAEGYRKAATNARLNLPFDDLPETPGIAAASALLDNLKEIEAAGKAADHYEKQASPPPNDASRQAGPKQAAPRAGATA